MAGPSEAMIIEALRGVAGPDGRGDLVGLGMVSGVAAKDGNVGFAIEIDPRRAGELEPLRAEAERVVQALPGVLSVTAVLTAHRAAPGSASTPVARGPAHPHAHDHGHAHVPEPRPQARAGKALVPGVRHIVAVASGKGGVGKSTTAVNLALAAHANGLRVGLLDADIYGPSQPRMMGISGKPTSPDGKRLLPMENHGIRCMSIGFMVAEDTPIIWRGPMVMSALNQLLRDVEWGELDLLVCDLPPGTGDAQLTMAQQVPLAGAIIVSTPQDIALTDARKGLNMFRKVEVPVLGIIENMSYFLCPHCGERSEIFSHGGAKREAERLGVEFLGELPLDMAIRETSDSGRPIVVADPESPHAKTYRAIAKRIWEILGAGTSAGREAPRIVLQ